MRDCCQSAHANPSSVNVLRCTLLYYLVCYHTLANDRQLLITYQGESAATRCINHDRLSAQSCFDTVNALIC